MYGYSCQTYLQIYEDLWYLILWNVLDYKGQESIFK